MSIPNIDLILGDNLFFGHRLPDMMSAADKKAKGGTVFGYRVSDPERYGVVGFDADGNVSELVEKPVSPPSRFAITGLYFLDENEYGAFLKDFL